MEYFFFIVSFPEIGYMKIGGVTSPQETVCESYIVFAESDNIFAKSDSVS